MSKPCHAIGILPVQGNALALVVYASAGEDSCGMADLATVRNGAGSGTIKQPTDDRHSKQIIVRAL